MKTKKVPLRCCCVTRERLEKKDLFRIVKYDGKVFVDDTYKSNGRGCYLKKEREVVEKAINTKALDKSLETNVPKEIYEQLLELLK